MKAVLYSRTCEQSRGPGAGSRRLGGGVSKGAPTTEGLWGLDPESREALDEGAHFYLEAT